MKVLVTGANGFVGGWLIGNLLGGGHEVAGAAGPGAPARNASTSRVSWRELNLRDQDSVRAAAAGEWDAVIHLAGLASGAVAMRDPESAWDINATGTARLMSALGEARQAGRIDPLVLVVSTAEVYGAGRSGGKAALVETDPVAPRSPYAASKLGAEFAARETALRTGLRVVIARPFPHTGPGQDPAFVVPAFAQRLRDAHRTRAGAVPVGNLDVTRDFLDVRDVVAAYIALMERGVPGETYNVASGRPVKLEDLFHLLAGIVGASATPETDPSLQRQADIPWLVGDATKLRQATGWTPRFTLEETLRDLVHAQAS